MGHHATREGKLTPKQARFVDEYLIDLNAKAAATRAGYSVRNPKNADRVGWANLQLPLVQQAIEAKQKRRAGRMEIKADDIAEEIRRVAFADIRDVLSVAQQRRQASSRPTSGPASRPPRSARSLRRSTGSASRCTASSTPSTSSRGSSGCMTTG